MRHHQNRNASRARLHGEPPSTSLPTSPLPSFLHNPQVLCHCHNCRKTTGSTYSTNIIFSTNAFKLVSGEPKVYEVKNTGSGNPVETHFCGECGATLWTSAALRPGLVVVKAGCLDVGGDAEGEGDVLERLIPKMETWTAGRPGWVGCVDGAVQCEKQPTVPSGEK